MGGSLLARENPFMAQGLVRGTRLRMDVAVPGGVESHTAPVEDVSSDGITILTPMKNLRLRAFAKGTHLHAAYVQERRGWRFVSEFTGASALSERSHLSAPSSIESTKRRASFRLTTAVKPIVLYRVVLDPERVADEESQTLEGAIVDLSEGGICFTSRDLARAGERLGLRTELPGAGEIYARLRVTGVDDPANGNRNRRIHCQFTDISQGDRDRIARYLVRRQIEIRRRGLL